MGTIKIPKEINERRRRFCGSMAMTVAAAQLGIGELCQSSTEQDEPAHSQDRDEHFVYFVDAD